MIVLSGPMTLSTDEWLMSLSCHRATFSMAAKELDLTNLASPVRFSADMGFLLCGMAEDPFCPGEKYSSASNTSVLWRCLNSTEKFSMDDAIKARVVKNSACLSLWTTWVDTGSGVSPKCLQTYSSTKGGILANVPTAPDMAPQDITSLALSILARFLFISSYMRATLRPNVTGSAWMPWERPISGVILYSRALLFKTSMHLFISEMMTSEASLRRTANDVSIRSEDVIPLCRNLDSGPMLSFTDVRNAITSCLTTFSISSIFFGSKLD